MTGKAQHRAEKRKQDIFNKAHPEGRTVFALRRNIEKHKNLGLPTKAMEDRLSKIAPNN